VALLVDYEKTPDSTPDPDWAHPDPERVTRLAELRRVGRELKSSEVSDRKSLEEKQRELIRNERRIQQERMLELRGWWLNRMVHGPRPLQEKLTLFWHGHFATSVQKVKDAYYMWLQNETFRRFANGNWQELLSAVAKDPAMLIWLDQAQSRREHPNENFAREVMELFALGEGNYTEKDVTEAARAFTGWTLNRLRQRYEYRSAMHDSGTKSVLGVTGNLNGSDVLRQIAARPQSGRFICQKLWAFFASENPSPELVTALAESFRRSDNRFKPVLREMFLSEEFYAAGVIGTQVKSPVQWLVNSVRLLQRDLPPPLMATNALRQLGQDLFAPPNVKGWDGGLTWITTNNLINRYNYSTYLVMGRNALPLVATDANRSRRIQERLERMNRVTPPVSVDELVTPADRVNGAALISALERRFVTGSLRGRQALALQECVKSGKATEDQTVLNALRLVLATPEFQLT
jgi:uncharacterized protein (DUF1800 family)